MKTEYKPKFDLLVFLACIVSLFPVYKLFPALQATFQGGSRPELAKAVLMIAASVLVIAAFLSRKKLLTFIAALLFIAMIVFPFQAECMIPNCAAALLCCIGCIIMQIRELHYWEIRNAVAAAVGDKPDAEKVAEIVWGAKPSKQNASGRIIPIVLILVIAIVAVVYMRLNATAMPEKTPTIEEPAATSTPMPHHKAFATYNKNKENKDMTIYERAAFISALQSLLNISSYDIQVLMYMCNETGETYASVFDPFLKLKENIDKIESGDDEIAEAFQKMGIKIYDDNGKIRYLVDIFWEAIDLLK